ncbi:hypothetical protein D3C76_1728900 [compost metagenome]
MPEIIVGPDQSHVLGQLQALVIQLQHLFIRDEGFQRIVCFLLPQHNRQDLLLVPDHLPQQADLGLHLFLLR